MFRSHSSWVNKDTTSFSDQFRKMLSATIPAPVLMPVPVSCRTVHSILPESFPPRNSGKSIFSDGPLTETANAHAPAVYYTSDIGTESLLQLYKPLSWALPGKTVEKYQHASFQWPIISTGDYRKSGSSPKRNDRGVQRRARYKPSVFLFPRFVLS